MFSQFMRLITMGMACCILSNCDSPQLKFQKHEHQVPTPADVVLEVLRNNAMRATSCGAERVEYLEQHAASIKAAFEEILPVDSGGLAFSFSARDIDWEVTEQAIDELAAWMEGLALRLPYFKEDIELLLQSVAHDFEKGKKSELFQVGQHAIPLIQSLNISSTQGQTFDPEGILDVISHHPRPGKLFAGVIDSLRFLNSLSCKPVGISSSLAEIFLQRASQLHGPSLQVISELWLNMLLLSPNFSEPFFTSSLNVFGCQGTKAFRSIEGVRSLMQSGLFLHLLTLTSDLVSKGQVQTLLNLCLELEKAMSKPESAIGILANAIERTLNSLGEMEMSESKLLPFIRQAILHSLENIESVSQLPLEPTLVIAKVVGFLLFADPENQCQPAVSLDWTYDDIESFVAHISTLLNNEIAGPKAIINSIRMTPGDLS